MKTTTSANSTNNETNENDNPNPFCRAQFGKPFSLDTEGFPRQQTLEQLSERISFQEWAKKNIHTK